MLCKNCGIQVTGEGLLCQECGTQQVSEQSNDSSYVALQANIIENFAQVSQQQSNQQTTSEEDQPWYKEFDRLLDSSRYLFPLVLLGGAVVIFLIANWFQSLVNSSMFSMTYDQPEKFSGIFLALLAELTFWGGWVLSVLCAIGGVVGLVARDTIVWKRDLAAPVPESSPHPVTESSPDPVTESSPQSNSFDDEQTVTISSAVVNDVRCSSCGEEILDTERFCTSCGMPIREHATQDTATLAAERAAAEREAAEREAVEKATAEMEAIERAAREKVAAEERAAEERAAAEKVAAEERAAREKVAAEERAAAERAAAEKAAAADRAVAESAAAKPPPTLRVKVKKRAVK